MRIAPLLLIAFTLSSFTVKGLDKNGTIKDPLYSSNESGITKTINDPVFSPTASALSSTAPFFSPKAEHLSFSPEDRKFLLNYFRETGDKLMKSIEGLNSRQMQFKPAEDRWSAAECLEHIILIDKALFDMAKNVIEAPANPERKEEVKATDEQIISGMTDRSQKAQAPEFGVPKGTYTNTADAIAAFKEQRKMIKEYIKNTPENLRDHITDSPGGPVDAYQFLLFIAGHCARHTKQIEEVKAHPEFPSGD